MRIALIPDSVPPGLTDRQVTYHDLRRTDRAPSQFGGIVQVEQSQVIRKLIDAKRPSRARQQWKLEHRVIPFGKIPEHLTHGRLGLGGQVPDVIVGMIDAACTLRAVLIHRMPRFPDGGGGQEREDAVGQQSGRAAPCAGVESIQHEPGPMRNEHVDGTGACQMRVRADHPSCRRRVSPHQSNPREYVLEVDQQRSEPGPRTFFPGCPA